VESTSELPRRYSVEGAALSILPCAALGLAAWAVFRTYHLSPLAAAAAALPVALACALALRRFTPPHLRTLTVPGRGLRLGWAVVVALVLLETARLSAFIATPDRRHSMIPASDFLARHSCATAYYEAARVLRDGEPGGYIYQQRYGVPGQGRRQLGPFGLDAYEYTPAFLLVPRLLLAAGADFLQFRALWNFLMVLAVLAGLALVAVWLPPRQGQRAALAAPLALLGLPTITGLQMGNVHMAMVAVAVAAMIAFDRARPALGGALLGYALLSKLSPGILVVYLAVRRQWRATAWVAIASLAWLGLAVLAFGIEPWRAFIVDHLPRLDSGQAFPQLREAGPLFGNMSIPGILLKLKWLGAAALGAAWQVRALGWLFTAVVVWLAVRAARARITDPLPRVSVWLALLTLAALRSVFVPPHYGLYPALWLATLLLCAPDRRTARVGALCLACAPLLGTPTGLLPLPLGAALSALAQLLSLAVAVIALRPPPAPSATAPDLRAHVGG
jgi:alpha-1,2-mannosyltransferase